MTGESTGAGVTLEEFRQLSEREQFAHWYGTQIGLERLRTSAAYKPDGSDSNHTVREITRSKFGVINIRRNIAEGRKAYDDNSA